MTEARGKGRPRRTEAAKIDRALHDAAVQVLLEHGEAATMNAVAVAAGLSRKTVYARYPNRTELFLDVIRELLKGAKSLEYDASGTAEERLRHYIVGALRVISQPQSLAIQRLLTIDPTYIAALKPDMVAGTRKIFFEPLHLLLGEAGESGELVIVDVEHTARALITLVFAESVALGSSSGLATAMDHEGYATFLAKLFTRGLLPRPA
jgi:TetR/AcrR family transcriptional repressor of mexJK operon